MARQLPELLEFQDGSPVKTQEEWGCRREEIEKLLQQEYCGFEPPLNPRVDGQVAAEDMRTAFAGKVIYQKINISCNISSSIADMKNFTFPCHFVRPKAVEKPPVFVYLSFSPALVDELLPLEEIIDNGFAVAGFYYQNVAPDTDDGFMNGIATAYGHNPYDAWGKTRMWAWGASRITDYLMTLPCIDTSRIAVVGHSRLGKAALLAGAFDPRFSLTISNDSGGAGAAIFRGKVGEMVKNFRGGTSSTWFAGNFRKYVRRENEMPFDMHFLLSLIAPRNLYVCSAKEDLHADPKSEFLSCVAASQVYESIYEKKGLVLDTEEIPEEAVTFPIGNVGYHMREGTHFLSRYDWQKFMEYRNMPEHIC